MFNKNYLVALLVCACYISTICARPQLPGLGNLAGGLTGGGSGSPVDTATGLLHKASSLAGPALRGALAGAGGGVVAGLAGGALG